MDIAKITNDVRLSEWLQVMRDHKASGMNINSFCDSRGIKRHAFYYWQRKLREHAGNAIIEQAAANIPTPSGWLMLEPAEADTGKTLEVTVNGFAINVGMDTDPELLKKVCSILRAVQ